MTPHRLLSRSVSYESPAAAIVASYQLCYEEKKKNSRHVTVDLTGRDQIQIKNRAALGKRLITCGMTKLAEYDNQEKDCVEYMTSDFSFFLFA